MAGERVALKFYAHNGDPYRRSCFDREGVLLDGALKHDDRFVQLVSPPASLQIMMQVVGPGGVTLSLPFDLPYLAMEWMDGGDAEQFTTKTTGREELLGKLSLFDQMCECVAAAHRKGCVHRDLKPGNFLLRRGRVKLSDFGAARMATLPPLLQQYIVPVGDLRYTAPELVAGIGLAGDHAAVDAYSMGAIFFELLTGQQLSSFIFGSLIHVHVFLRQMQAVPEGNRRKVYAGLVSSLSAGIPSLRTVNPDLPKCSYPLLDRILGMLISLDPAAREVRFDEVRRVIRMCRIVVENEMKYLAMLERRRARKKGRNT